MVLPAFAISAYCTAQLSSTRKEEAAMTFSTSQRAINFRKFRNDDGLLGYIEYEFKSTSWACDSAIQIVDGLTGINDKDSIRVRLLAQNKMIDLLLEEIRADRANPEVISLLGIAAAFLIGVFSMKTFDIDANLTGLFILAAALILLIFIVRRAFRTDRARKTEDVLVLVQEQTCLQLQRLENVEWAHRTRGSKSCGQARFHSPRVPKP